MDDATMDMKTLAAMNHAHFDHPAMNCPRQSSSRDGDCRFQKAVLCCAFALRSGSVVVAHDTTPCWFLLVVSRLVLCIARNFDRHFLYGGFPFLIGLKKELKQKNPGMMTLIGFAITVAYVYSAATVLGLKGTFFFWELATLILIMLLGHWMEMKSIAGASKSLELLVDLMPSDAYLFNDGNVQNVKTGSLKRWFYCGSIAPPESGEIKELQSEGECVAMTGTGIVPVNSNPDDIVSLILFGKATYKKWSKTWHGQLAITLLPCRWRQAFCIIGDFC